MSDCVYTRAECHHKGCKCSECPLTDLICDEFTDCLDLSYQKGKEDSVSEFIKLADSILFAKKLRGISCDWWEAMMEAQEKMKEQKNEC